MVGVELLQMKSLIWSFIHHLQTRRREEAATKRVQDLEASLDDVSKKYETAVEERDVLERNISALYNTAKLELERKNKEIQELRQR